jgi:hypothetical protein
MNFLKIKIEMMIPPLSEAGGRGAQQLLLAAVLCGIFGEQ